MDIRNWSLDRIMQLPDHCFGQRTAHALAKFTVDANSPQFLIHPDGLPDVCVLWEIGVSCNAAGLGYGTVGFALGDALPANDAQFEALDPLLRSLRDYADTVGSLTHLGGSSTRIRLRKAVRAQGRRLVVRFTTPDTGESYTQVYIVISSIPTEVPDWLCSGRV